MAVFEYKGFDAAGKAVSGSVDSDGAKNARAKLRKQGVFPTDVVEQNAKAGGVRGKGINIQIDFSKYFQRVSAQDLSSLTSQLSTLVGAGIPMVEALSAMIDQVENPKLRVVLAEVRDKVNEGSTLAQAMRDHKNIFSDLYVNMVRAGETSGALDVVLLRLAEYTESQVKLQGKLISAMIYPVLMTLVGLGIVLGLFVFVIPKIRRVFDTFGESLPFITRALLGVSDVVVGYWWAFFLLAAAAAFFFRKWVTTPEGRFKFDGYMLQVPIFGRLNRLVAVSRCCRTMSTLLNSGVPILSAMGIVATVVNNKVIEKAVVEASKNVTEGESLAGPLKASGQFPPIVTHMIAIGERTGELESMLGKVADAYDSEVDNMVGALTSLLEPVLILAMGGIVAFVAIAIMLPMMNMSAIAR
ncbi:MAG: type II secretion system inner membrane protein GspF [Deltaproteobacteria bacterium]|nr:type II secretion system inner membrane protein GspF [Deltaproteobacteria bacterium]MBK9367698.1 type II secretion system inner membrane protein GspF [Deltaproteobacteria bacterium]